MESFRSKVFCQAWQIKRQTGKTFSICLMKAWAAYRLKERMTKETVKFAFEKVDGSLRYAWGTLTNLPSATSTAARNPNYKTLAYFDVEVQDYRCFKIENLIRVY